MQSYHVHLLVNVTNYEISTGNALSRRPLDWNKTNRAREAGEIIDYVNMYITTIDKQKKAVTEFRLR